MTIPRMPGASHRKVDELRTQAEGEYNRLFYFDKDGRRQPQYNPALMAEKEAEIVGRYDAALAALMVQADKAHTEAEAILSKVDNPYGWLTDAEMQRAATLAPFIREDIAAMDAGRLIDAVKSAADGDKVTRWLIARYADGRYRDLDNDATTTPGMAAKAAYEMARAALRDGLIPADRVKERAAAQQKLDDAETLFSAAEWARPEARQQFADTVGVDVQYLP